MHCEGCAHWAPKYAPYLKSLVNTCSLPKGCEDEDRCKYYAPRKERHVLSILQFIQVHAD